jgi:predicted TIM-barrel fold metal-dependent hydrolase
MNRTPDPQLRVPGLGSLEVLDVDVPEEAALRVALLAANGARAVVLPLHPHTERRYDQLRYDPLWTALESAHLPIVFHRGVVRDADSDPLPFDLALHRVADEDPLYDDLREVLEVSYARMAILAMILSGTFARHPRLQVVVAGYGCTWVPYALARMDLQYSFRPERADGALSSVEPQPAPNALAPERDGFRFPAGERPSDHFSRHVTVLPKRASGVSR